MTLLSKARCDGKRQRGVIAIMVGLSIVVVIAAGGLALDAGRLYISKTETQNAADACALAAAHELTSVNNITLPQRNDATSVGQRVAALNRINFNSTPILESDVTVLFGTSLAAGADWQLAAAASSTSQYVRCTINEAGIVPTLMQVMGFTEAATVSSLATATLAPSANSCAALPVSLCTANSAPPFGFTPGQWLTALFGNSGGNGNGNNNDENSGPLTGNFGWIDFSPPSGGSSELSDILLGSGACSVAPGSLVGATGARQSIRQAWNTRFGIYAGGPSNNAGVPDRSGYSYTTRNWPSGSNALSNFLSVQRPANAPYGTSVADGNRTTGLTVGPPGATVRTSAELAALGSSRRIAPVPIVQCSAFASAQTVPLLGWGCALMLHPISQRNGPSQVVIEYIGMANEPGSPCATYGGVSDALATGPLVPALVQ